MAANTPQQAVQAVKKAEDEAKQQNQSGRVEDAREQQKQQRVMECTIIVSGFSCNNGPNANLLSEANSADKIFILFDAVENYSYSRTVQKSEYAVETNVTYSDHAVIKDDVFSLTAYINSSPTYIRKGNKIDQDTDPQRPADSRRPAVALEILKRCVDERQKITLATEEGTLEDFIITKLTAKRDTGEGAALVVDLEFQQFRTFTIGKVVDADVTTDAKKSPTKNKGAVQSSTKGDDKFKKEPTALAPDKEVQDGKGAGPDKHKSYVIKREKMPNSIKETVKGDNKQSDIPG